MPFSLGFWAAAGAGGGASSDYELISTTILGASTGSVTFSSIAGTYKHLQLRITARHDGAVQAVQTNMYFNSDQAANYSWHALEGNGSTAVSFAQTSKNNVYLGGAASGTTAANNFSSYLVDILDYASTNKYKVTRTMHGYTDGTYKNLDYASGLWQSTSAISSITIAPVLQGGNFITGSRFSLYGIKG